MSYQIPAEAGEAAESLAELGDLWRMAAVLCWSGCRGRRGYRGLW